MLAQQTIYRINPDFIPRQIAGEIVLIPVRKQLNNIDSIFNLNPVGAFVWNLLDGQRDLETILNNMLIEYETDRDTARNDLAVLISQLEEIKAIIKV